MPAQNCVSQMRHGSSLICSSGRISSGHGFPTTLHYIAHQLSTQQIRGWFRMSRQIPGKLIKNTGKCVITAYCSGPEQC